MTLVKTKVSILEMVSNLTTGYVWADTSNEETIGPIARRRGNT